MNWIPWALVVALLLVLLATTRRRLAAARDQVDAARREAAEAHRLAAQRLDEADRFKTAFHRANLGIVVLDDEGAVIEANRVAQEFVGGRHGAALTEAKIHELAKRARTEGSVMSEFETRLPAPRSLRVTAVAGENQTTAFVEDITERRQVDAARTNFVANVSHELKSPLGALALLAETLGSTEDPVVRARLLARLEEQATRMSRLIDDILDLSMVESGGNDVSDVDINRVIATAVAGVREAAVAGGVLVDVDVVPAEITVAGSERQLVSAVSNLMSNAVKYTAEAAPPRQVTARARLAEDQVVIEVEDTGIGIPLPHRQRIFERFYRVDRARSRETGGTGLGLAIVRHVALNHGGSVAVESESGVGSTFRMTIPLGRRA